MLTDITNSLRKINENVCNTAKKDSKQKNAQQKDMSKIDSYKIEYISEDNKNILFPLNYIR